ncbi:MAG: alpha/beta hydrolase [Saprospiraceae bacterium]
MSFLMNVSVTRLFFPLLLCSALGSIQTARGQSPALPAPAIFSMASFTSKHVDARRVDVWLPKGYRRENASTYAVLYMHDGQNLFDTTFSYGGHEWHIDEVAARMLAADSLRPFIVVGVWNSPKRFREFAPEKPFARTPEAFQQQLGNERGRELYSDAYLRFLVSELKPFVDAQFGCSKRKEDTFIMGSSMGGLISLYAVLEYPAVFGGAACVSTHWPLSLQKNDHAFSDVMGAYMQEKLPAAGNPKLYFDYGTTTLDSLYEPHQLHIDSVLRGMDYPAARWKSLKFEGAAHKEASWAERVDIPLYFLLGKP